MMEVNYTYTANNFLGAGQTVTWEDGMDPLYNVPHSYVYGTGAREMVDGKIARQVDRTFNRFHLLTEEKTTQDHCVRRQATLYYAEDRPFTEQPAQFQLPKFSTRNENQNGASKRITFAQGTAKSPRRFRIVFTVHHSASPASSGLVF